MHPRLTSSSPHIAEDGKSAWVCSQSSEHRRQAYTLPAELHPQPKQFPFQMLGIEPRALPSKGQESTTEPSCFLKLPATRPQRQFLFVKLFLKHQHKPCVIQLTHLFRRRIWSSGPSWLTMTYTVEAKLCDTVKYFLFCTGSTTMGQKASDLEEAMSRLFPLHLQ